MSEDRFAELDALVAKNQRFVLTTHVNPDGDGLGCEVAIGLHLRSLGKHVTVVNDGAIPHNFDFLAQLLPLDGLTPLEAEQAFAEADVAIIVDMQNKDRLGRNARFVDRPGLKTVILDHHVGDAAFAQLNIVVPEKAATGELVYDWLKRDPRQLTKAISEALYTALVTDTGSFRHSNTDRDVHEMAGHLIALGVESAVLQARINRHRHMGRLRFIGHLLGTLQATPDGTVAWFEVTPELFTRFDVDGTDTEGLVDFPRTVPGVEAVMMLTLQPDGRVKASLRSSGRVDVNRIAQSFGGGGHRFAAGATLPGPLPEARTALLAKLAESVEALDPAQKPYTAAQPARGA